MLNKDQQQKLLKIARTTIAEYMRTGEKARVQETDPALNEQQGAFVTLHINGELRGCIGNIIGDAPLAQTIANMAVEAGFGDPRFNSLQDNELDKIDIEISVMSPLEKIKDPEKIEPGKHGILLRKGFNSGLLLPQVATEYNWGREEFLDHTCLKAGLKEGEWHTPGVEIYIFSAEVFGEKT